MARERRGDMISEIQYVWTNICSFYPSHHRCLLVSYAHTLFLLAAVIGYILRVRACFFFCLFFFLCPKEQGSRYHSGTRDTLVSIQDINKRGLGGLGVLILFIPQAFFVCFCFWQLPSSVNVSALSWLFCWNLWQIRLHLKGQTHHTPPVLAWTLALLHKPEMERPLFSTDFEWLRHCHYA